MSPETLMFGRLTHGTKRINLGRGPIHIVLTRAMEQMRQLRKQDEMVIQIELGTSKLMDSTTFDRAALQEQEFAQNLATDPNAESPFPGITIGRVTEVIMTPEYDAYAGICDPLKRQGLTLAEIANIRDAYWRTFPDCAPYFPKWIDS